MQMLLVTSFSWFFAICGDPDGAYIRKGYSELSNNHFWNNKTNSFSWPNEAMKERERSFWLVGLVLLQTQAS